MVDLYFENQVDDNGGDDGEMNIICMDVHLRHARVCIFSIAGL